MEKPGYKNKILKEFIRPLPLDENFCPAAVWNHIFLTEIEDEKVSIPLSIAIVKDQDNVLVHNTRVFPQGSFSEPANFYYVEQIVKTLLWLYGGYKIVIGGSSKIGKYIKKLYSKDGKRSFDVDIMSKIYEKPFTVEITNIKQVPDARDKTIQIDRNLEGCRIGFDLGASDRKVKRSNRRQISFFRGSYMEPGQPF
ncbi:MAG: hypothetical protein U5N58_01565 [Actinomycetota bacterium]|nr:hypothetical protein [Actinomycetota bacterium]